MKGSIKSRKFWLISVGWLLAALGLHLGALDKAGKGARNYSSAMNLNFTQDQRIAFKSEASKYFRAGNALRFGGIFAALVGAIAMVFSYLRSEPAPRSIAIGMMVAYVLLQFAIV
jgi:hypothetical protein